MIVKIKREMIEPTKLVMADQALKKRVARGKTNKSITIMHVEEIINQP